jgi:hypothetical protein
LSCLYILDINLYDKDFLPLHRFSFDCGSSLIFILFCFIYFAVLGIKLGPFAW